MDSLNDLSDEELRSRLRRLASDERGCLVSLLQHLAELDRRDVVEGAGFSSLYDYCRRELKYSEDEAVRRIIVARAAKNFPQVLNRIEAGAISLSIASAVSPHLTAGNVVQVLTRAENMTVREARAWAVSQSPQKDRPDIIKPLSPGRNLFSFTGGDDLLRKLDRAKELLWHKFPDGRLEHVIGQALNDMLQKRDPALKAAARAGKGAESGARYVPQAVRLEVWRRDEGRCAFTSADGRRCEERSGLEYDHVSPYALGGASTVDNLRLLCRAHNQFQAREVFGDAAARFGRH